MDFTTMLTIHEVADRWRVGHSTVRKAINRGQIRAVRIGASCIRIPVEEVERLEASSILGQDGESETR